MTVELVIFDMDGLMFDTEQAAFRAYMKEGERRKLPTNRQQFVQLLGLVQSDIEKTFQDFFGETENFDGKEFYQSMVQGRQKILDQEGIPVKPGLRALLDYLEQKGIRKVVASSSSVDTIESYLKQSGLSDRFDQVFSSQNVKRGKPAPDLFLEACRVMGVEPEHALVLEDSVNGIRAAVAGGIRVIAVPDMIPIPPDLQKDCDKILKTLNEVKHYIE